MNDTYIHGTSDEEQRRLALMNELINAACVAELRLDSERHVLDVGCGTGQFTRLMARHLPAGAKVVGIERDRRQLDRAAALAARRGEADRVHFEFGEAGSIATAPMRQDRFDLVFCRFVLEHLREPDAAVADMVRAVRPGGRVVLADDDHATLRFWPEPAELQAAWRAYYETYADHGNDPFVGRRLVQLLHANGATPARSTLVFYGACSGQKHFEAIVLNLIEVLRGARDTVLASGRIDSADYDKAIRSACALSQRADAAVWYSICWAEGLRPD